MKRSNDELFKIYSQTRDIKTRNLIVENNLRYVKKIADYYFRRSKETFQDLFQVGVIGLIKAVEKYDLSKNVKFTPFALPWIRGEIIHWLRDKGHLIRIPAPTQDLHQKVKRYSEKNNLTYIKAAQELGINKQEAKKLNKIYIQHFQPIKEDSKIVSHYGTIDSVELSIYELISILSEEQRLVISCRILQEMTIKDTAISLKLKPNEVKKIQEQSINILKQEFCNNG